MSDSLDPATASMLSGHHGLVVGCAEQPLAPLEGFASRDDEETAIAQLADQMDAARATARS